MQLRVQILIATLIVGLLSVLCPCLALETPAVSSEVDYPQPSHQTFSLKAKPKDSCSTYLVAEIGLLIRTVNSQRTTDLYHRDGSHTYGEDFGSRIAIQGNLGLMVNLSHSTSLGVVGFGVVEEHRSRAGLKLRYRFWEWVGTAIDLEGGAVIDLATDDFTKNLDRRQWFVAGLSLSHTQLLHFDFQVESWVQDYPPKRRTSAAYVGLRFGY